MTSNVKRCFIGAALAFVVTGCIKNDEPVQRPGPVSSPFVTTAPVTNITATTATVGGTVVNGGDPVKVSGICWSKTNPEPSLADDTINTSVTNGNFMVLLKNLSAGTTYYVRAYAKNGWGTGYGKVVSFSYLNTVPEARNINVTGSIKVSQKIKVSYNYIDVENDAQGASGFQWYYANDTTGSQVIFINHAEDSLFTIPQGFENMYLQVAIVPKAKTGSSPGTEVRSFWVGPVNP